MREANPKVWFDQDGKEIPSRLITALDKKRQRHASNLLKRALKMSEQLKQVKSEMEAALVDVQTQFCNEQDVEPTPGFTFYNYDKGIKVERTRNEQVKFDEALLDACKQKFDEYLGAVTDEHNQLIIDIVKGAFTQVKGRPDSKKLLTLLSYRGRVSHPVFQEALNLLDQSIGKGNSKLYYKISERLPDGSYKQINLDFASI